MNYENFKKGLAITLSRVETLESSTFENDVKINAMYQMIETLNACSDLLKVRVAILESNEEEKND